MKTKLIVFKKAATFCCLLLAFFYKSSLSAQIIYTDIVDATPSATYPLDLNNDNVVDFLIQFDLSTKVVCKPQNTNAYSGSFADTVHFAWALTSTTSICASLATWYDATNPGTMVSGTTTGYWVAANNKYLALKLNVGSNTYYGWARFDFDATSTSFTIKDYAYESSPNACIQAGQTIVGLTEISSKFITSLFPNPFSSALTIRTDSPLKNAKLTICNAYGQTVKQVENISGQTITLLRDHLASGLYFVRLTDENKIIAEEKLIIAD